MRYNLVHGMLVLRLTAKQRAALPESPRLTLRTGRSAALSIEQGGVRSNPQVVIRVVGISGALRHIVSATAFLLSFTLGIV
jgi:hypothetical protein